jgi:hypothetical protein
MTIAADRGEWAGHSLFAIGLDFNITSKRECVSSRVKGKRCLKAVSTRVGRLIGLHPSKRATVCPPQARASTTAGSAMTFTPAVSHRFWTAHFSGHTITRVSDLPG